MTHPSEVTISDACVEMAKGSYATAYAHYHLGIAPALCPKSLKAMLAVMIAARVPDAHMGYGGECVGHNRVRDAVLKGGV
jgi:hypothetical protein